MDRIQGIKTLTCGILPFHIDVTRLLRMSRYETKTLKRLRVLNRYRRKDTVHSSPSDVSSCNSIASRAVCDVTSRFALAFRF